MLELLQNSGEDSAWNSFWNSVLNSSRDSFIDLSRYFLGILSTLLPHGFSSSIPLWIPSVVYYGVPQTSPSRIFAQVIPEILLMILQDYSEILSRVPPRIR